MKAHPESKIHTATAAVETTLISLISLGIRVSQWIGYFPLSIVESKNNSKLAFHPLSFPLSCSFIFITWQTILLIEWYPALIDKLDTSALLPSTEVVSFIIHGSLIAFQAIAKRVIFICKRNIVLEKWSIFVTDLTRISSSDEDGSFLISIDPTAKHCNIFKRVKVSVRNTVFGSVALIFVLVSEIFVTFVLLSTGKKGVAKRTGISLVGAFSLVSWNLFGAFNVFQSLWVTFPIQVTNACLEMIGEEMRLVYGGGEGGEEDEMAGV